ncbi:lipid IV(A) 3-deoxy-D-manno-octulosonic acid transferase [Enterovibrio norvegicus]|uniref:3-deoxy-D-manno-octulosonic acid transferase n=1 Tax=Enterovibrio norvegicus TaxID=188144 RepID=A0A2N7LEA6_9GAMM|nr:lipid IV(A) 3-deoxy-D-manno-octulosonic acid transferase [Enterovibrio norvegicus]PML79736.1 3-deoxy-D-manno-octulosonic acid transferase [Enterovibrio norvegicus]PMN69838.1 3-deoxy-D-manno-octulosonic acid transferase [Enterovibrio norvegicus]PMN93743.1 3-deoxy-D-manno-octulosonic acid transferase [Enterovibrio norvegicus]
MLARLIYTLLLFLVSPVLLWVLYRKHPNKPAISHRWKEYWGFTPALCGNHPLWIHAVSVGEVIAISPLIRELKRQEPSISILLTTTTTTGAEQAKRLGDLVEHRYMPIDFSHCVKRFVLKMQPKAMVIVETELWPNTLHTVSKARIPITVINARLSENSAKGYRKIKPLFDIISHSVNQILCLHTDDAKRFIGLGVDERKVSISGSIKYDLIISPDVIVAGSTLRSSLGLNRPVWIAASTHKGEDEQMLSIHRNIADEHPDALLILVPRHPERFNDVEANCKQQGFITARRSNNQAVDKHTQVYLGDTMGELLIMLQCADITVIGGSLIGDKVGGHNLLEPAALGKPSLIGPSYFNFTDITRQLATAGATKICDDKSDISATLLQLFSDKQKCNEMSKAALSVVNANRGAINYTIKHILKSMN